jgi:hypothetical protein
LGADIPAPVAPEARPARVVAVLGMHRSGTSALAGSLEQHGLFLGHVSTSNAHNPKGNRESTEVRRLNEDVLRSSGGAWKAPPAAVRWSVDQNERARRLLADHAGRPTWGFKDPRTLLTLAGWQALVPDIEYVGIFRHPMRVARSLEQRDEMDSAAAVALWHAYNVRLLEAHRDRPFPLLCFDDEPQALRQKLVQVAAALELEERSGEETFFAPDLRRAEEAAAAPADAQALYDELRALAL